jgi:dipeptidyl aminopeptidase/acylaminoacyl peptidase
VHSWPQFLPDGRHFLYWAQAKGPDSEKSGVIVGSLDDKSDVMQRRRVLSNGSMALYAADHLFFARDGVLLAEPFDATRFEARGDSVVVAPKVGQILGRYGWTALSVSPGGTLAYETSLSPRTQLIWFDRVGTEIGRVGQPDDQLAPRLSPDQKRVAVARRGALGFDIWLFDLTRDTSTRLTFFHPGQNSVPVWSPDGDTVAFNSNREGQWDLYLKATSGSGGEEPLLKSSGSKLPIDWSADGRFLLYQAPGPKTKYDLWVLPLSGDRKPFPVVQTEFDDVHGQFSPDGGWLAYQSDQSLRPEVYVQAFPKSSGVFQVSTNGGSRPRWRRDGKELFYLSPDNKMMAVEVKPTATGFETGRPRELFQTPVAYAPFVAPTYDVAADGQRFLIDSAFDQHVALPMTVVMNWSPKR